MSYILDALKNSQDSRSRGAVPDLASQMAAAHHGPSRRERIWRLVALVTVLLLLAALVVLGWKTWLAPAPSTQAMLPPFAERPAPVAALVADAQQPAAPVAAPVEAPVASVQPPAAPQPVQPTPAAPAVESQAPGLAALQQLAGVRVNVDAPQSPPPVATGAAPSGPPPVVQKLELPMERPPVAASAKPAPLLPSAPIRPAPAAQEPPVAEYGAVEHWKQLPAQIQQQLREMPFNVHIYANDPKLRFVKTGGRTLREGDPINGELRMLHITRDGVIVGYKGGKYWMRLS